MPVRELQHVKSSNIASASYDEESGELSVKFNSGATYVYSEVPLSIAIEFESAPSAGKYLDSMIKGIYPYKKV